MKEGAIVEEVDLSQKPFYLVGRQQELCDIFLENPTISRKHAVIQHKDTGDIYLYDMGSTHGTFVNKKQVPSHQYIKLNLNDMVRFGQSTRWFILNGPEELLETTANEEETSEEPRRPIQIVSKKQNKDFLLKKRMDQIKKFNDQMNQLKNQRISRIHGGDDEGVSWGMGFEEDEIAEFQKRQEEEGDDSGDESHEGESDSDDDSDEDVKLLNVEALR